MSKLEELKTERESIIKEIKKIRFEQSVDIKMRMNELERKMGELSRQIKIENEILLRQIRREEYNKKFETRLDMDISGTARILLIQFEKIHSYNQILRKSFYLLFYQKELLF